MILFQYTANHRPYSAAFDQGEAIPEEIPVQDPIGMPVDAAEGQRGFILTSACINSIFRPSS